MYYYYGAEPCIIIIMVLSHALVLFLSLFIIALGPPELGLFLTGAFWITSFVLSIRCMAKGVVRTGVSTMIFLTCVMPLLLFVALVSLGNGL